jgi:two-component system nitrogen regulation response regulator NtrX
LGRHQLVWTTRTMTEVMQQVERVAAGETRVAILGESGTGKELIARTIHEKSARHAGPFVTLNCASVPAELIESELFGHEKGAFTGAAGRRIGKFEQADGGTLFLDEIGDMPLAMQAKLLRVLEEGEIERVGGERPIPVNVRVVVATHQDLERMVRAGTFRQDLFHRIYVFPLRLPPLRERAEDVPALVEHFARQIAEQNGWKPRQFADATIAELKRYAWPGNVRELRNVVERLLLVAPAEGEIGPELVRSVLPALGAGVGSQGASFGSGVLAARVEGFERAAIEAELKRQNFHITNTAKALGLERSHLYKKCQQLGIDLDALRRSEW